LQQAKPAASPAVQSISKAPWIEDAGVPLWRKLAASALVGLAFLFGAGVLAIYAYIIWSGPPDFSHSSASHELKGLEFLYLFLPIMFLFGPIWAAGWLAKRIDPSRSDPSPTED
jgi:hypothetical protein